VHGKDEVEPPRLRIRLDHERAEEPQLHALRGVLMRVVPERPVLLRAEAVDVAAARLNSVLRDAGDAVLRVRDVEAVPVDRHAVADVLVDERDLNEISLTDAKLRAGRPAVERPGVHLLARRESHWSLLGGERDLVVRRALRARKGVDAEMVVHDRLRPTVFDGAVRHDVVAPGEAALPPRPR
jgi:hypothetical protein